MTTEKISGKLDEKKEQGSGQQPIATTPATSGSTLTELAQEFENQQKKILDLLIKWSKEQLEGSRIATIPRLRNWKIQTYAIYLIYALSFLENTISLQSRSRDGINNHIANMQQLLGLLREAYTEYDDLPGKQILSEINTYIKTIRNIASQCTTLTQKLTSAEQNVYSQLDKMTTQQLRDAVVRKLAIPTSQTLASPISTAPSKAELKNFSKPKVNHREQILTDFILKQFTPLMEAIFKEIASQGAEQLFLLTDDYKLFLTLNYQLALIKESIEHQSLAITNINLIPFSVLAKKFFNDALTTSPEMNTLLEEGKLILENFKFAKYEQPSEQDEFSQTLKNLYNVLRTIEANFLADRDETKSFRSEDKGRFAKMYGKLKKIRALLTNFNEIDSKKLHSFIKTANAFFANVSIYPIRLQGHIARSRKIYIKFLDVCIEHGLPEELIPAFANHKTSTAPVASTTPDQKHVPPTEPAKNSQTQTGPITFSTKNIEEFATKFNFFLNMVHERFKSLPAQQHIDFQHLILLQVKYQQVIASIKQAKNLDDLPMQRNITTFIESADKTLKQFSTIPLIMKELVLAALDAFRTDCERAEVLDKKLSQEAKIAALPETQTVISTPSSEPLHSKYYLKQLQLDDLKDPQKLADLKQNAEAGNPDAQFRYGQYLAGEKEPKAAVSWYRLAADQGDIRAMHELAHNLQVGKGIPQDIKESLRLYELAAEKGNIYSQKLLVNFYMYGKNKRIPKDQLKGEKFCKLAAENGDAECQNALGNYYIKMSATVLGDNERERLRQNAMVLFDQSIKQQFTPAYMSLADYYIELAKGIEDRTLKKIFQSQALAHYKQAANGGYLPSQKLLAEFYERGEFAPHDLKESAKWYHSAALQGDKDAQYKLAYLHERGEGISRNPAEAVRFYKLAADQGILEARYREALCYEREKSIRDITKARQTYQLVVDVSDHQIAKAAAQQGQGIELDKNQQLIGNLIYLKLLAAGKVAKLTKAAIKAGDLEAKNFHSKLQEDSAVRVAAELSIKFAEQTASGDDIYQLALCYERGQGGIIQDQRIATYLFIKAADMTSKPQFLDIAAQRFFDGNGVLLNSDKAFTLFKIAAAGGNAHAQYMLAEFFFANRARREYNISEAFRHFALAANQQDHKDTHKAMHKLAELHEWDPHSFPEQSNKIFQLYLKAAEGGVVAAQAKVADCYRTGRLVGTADVKESLRFYKSVATAGEVLPTQTAQAQFIVGTAYEQQKNIEEAARFYNLAAARGILRARYHEALCYEGESSIKNIVKAWQLYQLLAAQCDEKIATIQVAHPNDNHLINELIDLRILANAKLVQLSNAAAEAGDSGAKDFHAQLEKDNVFNKISVKYADKTANADDLYQLASYFESKEDAKLQDKRIATYLYTRAAAITENNPHIFNLADRFLYGRGVAKNLDKAFGLFKLAAEAGNIEAHHMLAEFFFTDQSTKYYNLHKAFEHFKAAASNNHTVSTLRLAELYEHHPHLFPEKHENIFNLYLKAAEAGDVDAQYRVAECYYLGKLIGEQNIEKSLLFYKLVAESKDSEALAIITNSQLRVANYYAQTNNPEEAAKFYDLYLKGIIPLENKLAILNKYMAWAKSCSSHNAVFASRLYETVARHGHEHGYGEAMLALAQFYERGHGVTRDVNKALSYYKQALSKGLTEANEGIARLTAPPYRFLKSKENEAGSEPTTQPPSSTETTPSSQLKTGSMSA